MSWIPETYEAPASLSGDYLKIKSGETHKIRILGEFKHPKTAIMGWLAWSDEMGERHPIRGSYTSEGFDECKKYTEKPKHFWALVIWLCDVKRIAVWEITQKTIQDSIVTLSNNPDWGSPTKYNLSVSRKGESLSDTVYTVVPAPPIAPASDEAKQAARDADIDLQKLFAGENPFGKVPETLPRSGEEIHDDIPFQ